MAILIPTTVTVTLDNDQIIALPTTRFEVVPTPGAGKIAVLVAMMFKRNFVTGYTGLDGTVCTLSALYASPSPILASNFIDENLGSGFLSGTGTKIALVGMLQWVDAPNTELYAPDGAQSAYEDLGICILAHNGSPSVDFGGGNVANALKVTALYVVVDV